MKVLVLMFLSITSYLNALEFTGTNLELNSNLELSTSRAHASTKHKILKLDNNDLVYVFLEDNSIKIRILEYESGSFKDEIIIDIGELFLSELETGSLLKMIQLTHDEIFINKTDDGGFTVMTSAGFIAKFNHKGEIFTRSSTSSNHIRSGWYIRDNFFDSSEDLLISSVQKLSNGNFLIPLFTENNLDLQTKTYSIGFVILDQNMNIVAKVFLPSDESYSEMPLSIHPHDEGFTLYWQRFLNIGNTYTSDFKGDIYSQEFDYNGAVITNSNLILAENPYIYNVIGTNGGIAETPDNIMLFSIEVHPYQFENHSFSGALTPVSKKINQQGEIVDINLFSESLTFIEGGQFPGTKHAAIANLNNGNVLYYWYGNSLETFGQLYDSLGDKIGGSFQLSNHAIYSIEILENDGFLMMYENGSSLHLEYDLNLPKFLVNFVVDSEKAKVISGNLTQEIQINRGATSPEIEGINGYRFDKWDVTFETVNGNLTVNALMLASDSPSKGNDYITGTDGDDQIYSRDGDDTIFGGEGDDDIRGGRGNDNLSGGIGTDTIFGGEGDDVISSDTGNDTLSGGLGNDFISPDFGDNTINGGDGIDTVFYDMDISILKGRSVGRNKFIILNKNTYSLDLVSNVEMIATPNKSMTMIEFVSGIQASVNITPIANADTYYFEFGETLVVDVHSGILSNDIDDNEDTLIKFLISSPRQGKLKLNKDGSFSYESKRGLEDSFTYQAFDGVDVSEPVTVQLLPHS